MVMLDGLVMFDGDVSTSNMEILIMIIYSSVWHVCLAQCHAAKTQTKQIHKKLMSLDSSVWTSARKLQQIYNWMDVENLKNI